MLAEGFHICHLSCLDLCFPSSSESQSCTQPGQGQGPKESNEAQIPLKVSISSTAGLPETGEQGKGRKTCRGEGNDFSRSTTLQVPGEAVTLHSPWAQKETTQPRDEGFALHPGGLHTPSQIPQEAATAPGPESPLLCGELSSVS